MQNENLRPNANKDEDSTSIPKIVAAMIKACRDHEQSSNSCISGL